MLPPFFALRRYRPDIHETHPDLRSCKDIGVLIQTEKVKDHWKFNLVEYPLSILDGAVIEKSDDDVWLNYDTPSCNVVSYEGTNHTILLKYNGYYIDNLSVRIPLFKLSDPCTVLSYEFYYLKERGNESYKINIVRGPLCPVTEVKVGKIKSNIPKHILDVYVNTILDKGERCPVTSELFTRDNIHITDCGHAVSNAVVNQWILKKKSCPVCRSIL
jgi:hypothetical protein